MVSREEITRLAQEAGFVAMDGEHGGLRRFAALVAAAEREACALKCEHMGIEGYGTLAIAAAIRAMGERLAQPQAMQVRPSEFVQLVKGQETLTGFPAYWAEWPNKEQP
jgi:hypothetical protein